MLLGKQIYEAIRPLHALLATLRLHFFSLVPCFKGLRCGLPHSFGVSPIGDQAETCCAGPPSLHTSTSSKGPPPAPSTGTGRSSGCCAGPVEIYMDERHFQCFACAMKLSLTLIFLLGELLSQARRASSDCCWALFFLPSCRTGVATSICFPFVWQSYCKKTPC